MSDPRQHVCIILGTRPEIIKLAPVIHECQSRDIRLTLIHTGQHYSELMDSVFFDKLTLPEPDYELDVGSNTHGSQTAEIIAGVEEVLLSDQPDTVLIQGDTNSVLGGAIATCKLPPRLGHVEAGLRSFNREMPEELNRILSDHAGDYLFAPTETAQRRLVDEGIPKEKIHVTGNTVIDSIDQYLEAATESSQVIEELDIAPGEFVLMTAHRAENVDDVDTLSMVLEGVRNVCKEFDVPTIYPIHPRTRERIQSSGIEIPPEIRLIEPLNYFDFLLLESKAALVLTDSGGVQEEACSLKTPCVTLRTETERPETVDVGANRVVGIEPSSILSGAIEMWGRPGDWPNPFGNGDAAKMILDIITDAGPTPSNK